MKLDTLTKNAISHTFHCFVGCAIGEVTGMIIGEALGWHNLAQTILAVSLAFAFGYLLTYISFVRSGVRGIQAIKGTLAVDSLSITFMEIIDNSFIWIIPGAIDASLDSWLFWWSLGLSLVVAFILTVPINRLLMKHGIGHGPHGQHDTDHENHQHHS